MFRENVALSVRTKKEKSSGKAPTSATRLRGRASGLEWAQPAEPWLAAGVVPQLAPELEPWQGQVQARLRIARCVWKKGQTWKLSLDHPLKVPWPRIELGFT